MSTFTQDPDTLGANLLSVALIGPEEARRREIALAINGPQANVVREFRNYPELDDVPQIIEEGYNVIIIDLDTNPEQALDLVEHIGASSSVTVMVYSASSDSELLVRCMRAGAREFLSQPFTQNTVAEALVRASVRRPTTRSKKTLGRLLMFTGAKGGSGVTTIASNFAIALAQESGQSTLLIDFDLPLGAAALDLGITAPYSTVDAIQNVGRLDSNFLRRLLTKHAAGLHVLSAPDKYSPINVPSDAVEKLITVSRQEFDYVVVDAGSTSGTAYTMLVDAASTIYLVTQVSISELRNSNRLITEFFASRSTKLQIVLNRFTPRSLVIDEESITKALTLPPAWKIPSDYPVVRQAQNSASPFVMGDSSIAEIIRQMARTACGLPAASQEKKKRFGLGLFG
ncbi:MAG TPA: AAA family ATPase [Acidobacteriaceae bacterium]|nr:AAA family ATPase [Acidobacteriaceae bacterium]